MKKKFVIGLGGSGGKIVANLMERLEKEQDKGYRDEVACIAIDTHQDSLDKLKDSGIKTACISNFGTVGAIINDLGSNDPDIYDWCPYAKNDGNFLADDYSKGASQCRIKSRLALAKYLRNPNNELKRIIDESFLVGVDKEKVYEEPPIILIASSIAGGTGAGIFIQIALYIKNLLSTVYKRDRIIIHGLFACPTLFEGNIKPEKMKNLYSNAYAVIRELNGMNLICCNDGVGVYGDIKVNVSMSSKSEGNLFVDKDGRYGDKPYDILYFVEKVNSMGNILGGLDAYYKAMADMAYSHIYSDISSRVFEDETNEKANRDVAPTAIYASAGASSIVYPYDDIVKYISDKALDESINDVWKIIDLKWKTSVKEKNKKARGKYKPTILERANFFIKEFKSLTEKQAGETNPYSFLDDMVKREDNLPADELFVKAILDLASLTVKNNEKIIKEKENFNFHIINDIKVGIEKAIDKANKQQKQSLFAKIGEIEESLPKFCSNCVDIVADISDEFSNGIYCDEKNLWKFYDEQEGISVTNTLLCKDGEWVHPVAVRYLLYSVYILLLNKYNEYAKALNDTAANDIYDVKETLKASVVDEVKGYFKKSGKRNMEAMTDKINSGLFAKSGATKMLNKYFKSLNDNLTEAEDFLVKALLFFSLKGIIKRIENLISQYEFFFDNIDSFAKRAKASANTTKISNEKSWNTVFVCASAEIKDKIYNKVKVGIDLENGEVGSIISAALFDSMRLKASIKNDDTENKQSELKSVESFYDSISGKIVEKLDSIDEVANLDKNIFEAMLYEYELENEGTEKEFDIVNYSSEDGKAKERVDRFIHEKLAALVKKGAPFLNTTDVDIYYKETHDSEDVAEGIDVATSYKYICHNASVEETMVRTLNLTSISSFYDTCSTKLLSGEKANFTYVQGETVSDKSILCYSTIHCLQPYQIDEFDELSGGKYYAAYQSQLSSMMSTGKYSLTPHLDIRWHKHSCLPYVNVRMELDVLDSTAKAFVYGICKNIIGYDTDKKGSCYIYRDEETSKFVRISFEGDEAIYKMPNRVLYWLAENDDISDKLSAKFDRMLKEEVESLEKYSDDLSVYEAQVTKSAFVKKLSKNILGHVPFFVSKNGKAKSIKTENPVGLLELARMVNQSEERRNETDNDNGERIVKFLCDIISAYGKMLCNEKDMKTKDTPEYEDYLHFCRHMRDNILEDYLNNVMSSIATKKTKKNELKKIAECTPEYKWAEKVMKTYIPD